TEATLRTLPLPGGRAVALFGFASLEAALRGARLAVAEGPTACELLDRRLLSLARVGNAGSPEPMPAAVEAALVIEFEGETSSSSDAAAHRCARKLQEGSQVFVRVAETPQEANALWNLREAALPSLYGMRGGAQPVACIEDVGVPVEELPTY